MRLAISQSNYIPWKGYFDLIASVDRFVLYDTVQYTKNDWRNRNVIKYSGGTHWLTIPVGSNINRTIQEVVLPKTDWRLKHWKSLVSSYSKAPFFDEVASWLQLIYLHTSDLTLSEFNMRLIRAICSYLGIKTEIVLDDGRCCQQDRVYRLIDICHYHGADTYVSAPAGKNYIRSDVFFEENINLEWFVYPSYPTYSQLHGPFVHQVSILDAIFHCGPNPSSIFNRSFDEA